MNKKTLILLIISLVIVVLGIFVLSGDGASRNFDPRAVAEKQNEAGTRLSEGGGGAMQAEAEDLILFYGESCPHCKLVEDYINDNNVLDKIDLVRKEVYRDRGNSDELFARARECGIKTDSVGVPFLWNSGECLSGDKDIINFFTEKMSTN